MVRPVRLPEGDLPPPPKSGFTLTGVLQQDSQFDWLPVFPGNAHAYVSQMAIKELFILNHTID